MTRTLLRLNIVAKRCGVSIHTVRYWCLTDRIRYVRLPGGHRRVPESEIEPFLNPVTDSEEVNPPKSTKIK